MLILLQHWQISKAVHLSTEHEILFTHTRARLNKQLHTNRPKGLGLNVNNTLIMRLGSQTVSTYRNLYYSINLSFNLIFFKYLCTFLSN